MLLQIDLKSLSGVPNKVDVSGINMSTVSVGKTQVGEKNDKRTP